MSSFLSSIVSALVPSAVSQPDRPSSRSSQPAVTSPKAASQDTTGRSFGGLPSSPASDPASPPSASSSQLHPFPAFPEEVAAATGASLSLPPFPFPPHSHYPHKPVEPRTEALDQAGADRSGGENEKEGSPDDARLPRPPDLDIESSAYPDVGYHGDSPRRSSVKVGHSKPSKKYSARAINSKLRSAASMAVMANVGKQNGLDSNLKDEMRNHLKLMLRQVLGENSPVWETVLMNLAIVAAQTVVPDVGSYNVKNCVKIKKIPGGEAADSRYIDGLVCSGNVMHKRMQRDLQLPRVVLLNFSLEYQKPTELTPLEPLSLHRVHVQTMCNKVMQLRPNLIVCTGSVSGLAMDILLKSDVIVVSRAKPSTLEKLSISTGADIINSVNEITPERRFGICGAFRVRTYHNSMIPGLRKSFLYFEGCDKEMGCTLVLRGGDVRLLDQIKQIAAFGVFVAYNMRLETSLMKDELAVVVKSTESSQQVIPETLDPNMELWRKKLLTAVDIFRRSILSMSPYVHFPPPYLLERLSNVTEIPDIFWTIMQNSTTDIYADAALIGSILPDNPRANRLHWDGQDVDVSLEVNSSFQYLKKLGNLNPLFYQNITFLASSMSLATGTACEQPSNLTIVYYEINDLTLGQFLESLCANANYQCGSKDCGIPLIRHYKSYAHRHGRLNVIMEDFSSSGEKLLMWSYCKKCNQKSPEVPMSDDTWKLSFGKYLEQTFYYDKMTCAAMPDCDHDIHREHVRFFGVNNYTVRFEYETIDLLEVFVPPMQVVANTDVALKLKTMEYESIRGMINRFYDSIILSRIKNFTFEIVPDQKISACKDLMGEYARKATAEKKLLQHALHQTFIAAPQTDMLALNAVIRALNEKTALWESLFTAIIRNYLQPEGRFTQIRGIFSDRTSSVSQDNVTGRSLLEPQSFSPRLLLLGTSPADRSELPPIATMSPTLSPLKEYGLMIRSADLMDDEAAILRADSFRFDLLIEDAVDDSLRSPNNSSSPTSSSTPSSAASPTLPRSPAGGTESGPAQATTPTVGVPVPRHRSMRPTPAVDLLGIEPTLSTPTTASHVTPDSKREGGALSRTSTIGGPSSSTSNSGGPGSTTVVASGSWRLIGFDDDDMYGGEANAITGVCSGDSDSGLAVGVGPVGLRPQRVGGGAATSGGAGGGGVSARFPVVAGERASIMKTISNLWNGNPGNLLPLENPIQPTEHVFQDSLVIVREDEPSSIIAFTLSSSHYKEKLQAMHESKEREFKSSEFTDISEKVMLFEDQPMTGDLEETLRGPGGNHIKFQFWDGQTRFDCKSYYAEQFDALRRNCGFDEIYVHSLSRCFRWEASGGKSKSVFMKTTDDRLILKQLSKPEMDALLKFAPAYFDYISEAFFHTLPTVLAKIFGFYRIGFKNPVTNRTFKIDVLVMENLFYDRSISRIFDLKGSMRNRHVQSTGRQNEVLLDENLVEYIGESLLFIHDHAKRVLRASVWNDTLFLSKLNVMDYSLLVGIDEERRELVVGIVDFIRTFTWDKKLESWVKETAFMGSGPTIISPRQYKNRFRDSMDRYFLSPPTVHNSNFQIELQEQLQQKERRRRERQAQQHHQNYQMQRLEMLPLQEQQQMVGGRLDEELLLSARSGQEHAEE